MDSWDLIHNAYDKYVATISTPHMAISLELAKYLHDFCRENRPTRILDLGSGFSTFVFSQYLLDRSLESSSDRMPVLFSFDTDPQWLDKTARFCSGVWAHVGQHVFHDVIYPETIRQSPPEYCPIVDLILFDIGKTCERKLYMPMIYKAVKHGSVIIIDDMHKQTVIDIAAKLTCHYSKSTIGFLEQTRDRFGRISARMDITL